MKILIDMPVHEPSMAMLRDVEGFSMDLIPNVAEEVRPLSGDLIRDCEVLFCTFPPENHIEMEKLKFIQISSAGFAQVIGKGFEKRGVAVCNALGVFDVPIAEWNIAMMINLKRNLRDMMENQVQGVWDRSARFQSELRGSVVGIWGYGGIGRETARLAKALGMQVHVLSRREIGARENIYGVAGTGDPQGVLPDQVFLSHERLEFLRGLDFLILAFPQTPSTIGIIGEKELQALPNHAFLLNPARGPLVDEGALLMALTNKWIAGAALDTHYYYPMPADHPLWKMKNVFMTPHISGSSASTHFLERVWDIFGQNIKRFLGSGVLLNQLSSAQLGGDD